MPWCFSPAVARDGTIYVGSKDHYLYSIKPDGTGVAGVAPGAEDRVGKARVSRNIPAQTNLC